LYIVYIISIFVIQSVLCALFTQKARKDTIIFLHTQVRAYFFVKKIPVYANFQFSIFNFQLIFVPLHQIWYIVPKFVEKQEQLKYQQQ